MTETQIQIPGYCGGSLGPSTPSTPSRFVIKHMMVSKVRGRFTEDSRRGHRPWPRSVDSSVTATIRPARSNTKQPPMARRSHPLGRLLRRRQPPDIELRLGPASRHVDGQFFIRRKPDHPPAATKNRSPCRVETTPSSAANPSTGGTKGRLLKPRRIQTATIRGQLTTADPRRRHCNWATRARSCSKSKPTSSSESK